MIEISKHINCVNLTADENKNIRNLIEKDYRNYVSRIK